MTLRGWIGILLLALATTAQARQSDRRIQGKTVVEWAALLKSNDLNERRAAAFYLSRAGKDASAVREMLTAALDDGDENVKVYSLRALGNCGESASPSAAVMAKQLRGSSMVRRTAVTSLSKLGERAVEPTAKALTDADPATRASAATTLGLLGKVASATGGALARALGDESFRVRRAAALALTLVEPRPDAILDPLLQALATDTDADVCRLSAVALGKLGKPAIPSVMKMLASDSADQRYHAAGALRELGALGAPAVKPLVAMLKGGDVESRAAASAALGGIGEEAVDPLVALLKDDDLALRRSALTALAEIGPAASRAAAPLVLVMKGKDRGLSEQATIALIRLGKPAVQPLLGVLKDAAKDADLRVLAVVGLAAIGKDAAPAVPALKAALKDSSVEVRVYAARALGRIGPDAKSAVPALKEASKDDDLNVRAAAAEAIKQIEGLGDG